MFDSTAHQEAANRLANGLRELHALQVTPVDSSWMVRGPQLPRAQRFPTREQAIGFARHWARDHRPSVVRLEIEPGETAGEWEYDDYRR